MYLYDYVYKYVYIYIYLYYYRYTLKRQYHKLIPEESTAVTTEPMAVDVDVTDVPCPAASSGSAPAKRRRTEQKETWQKFDVANSIWVWTCTP
jgi:hypothetical protein